MNNLFLCSAPMAGVSDKPFRQMIRLFGRHLLFTEMIGAESFARAHPVTCRMMQIQDEENIVVQLVGVAPEMLARAAQAAQAVGAVGVDINMGCPVKKLISNGSGAALMKNPSLACRLVETVARHISIPVSVKMRAGWNPHTLNAVEFSKALVNAGASRIEIHGRTREQGYAGPLLTDVIAAVKKAVCVPVIANGDVTDAQSALALKRKTDADGVMIGRGLCGRPWLMSEILSGKKPDFCLADLVSSHVEALLSYYGHAGLFIARKHIAWYGQGREKLAEFCKNVYACSCEKDVFRMIKEFF